MAKPYIGISGWSFPGWRKVFYPEDLVQKKELYYASRKVNSIEINGTFYALQRPKSFESWYEQTPKSFLFSIKAPQFMTHVLRLKEIEEPLANFLASGLLCLKEKLGPILWQFPPFVTLKDDRFEKFIKMLPRDTKAFSKMAKQHGEKVEGRAYTKTTGSWPIRYAFEFRHKSFLNKDFTDFLKAHNVAFVCAHAGGKDIPYLEEPTADFVYIRLHGEGKEYKKGYPLPELKKWERKLTQWNQKGLDTYIYFNNDAKAFAPAGAMKLIQLLKKTKR